jgi:hypothetical protein
MWAKLDDQYPRHRKTLAAGVEGFVLDVSAICWSNNQGTDGFIPEYALAALYPLKAPEKVAARLVEVGRWDRDDVRGGWTIHDFHDYNPTAEQAAATSRARADAGRKGGQRSGEARAKQPLKQPASKRSSKTEANASASAQARAQAGAQAKPKQAAEQTLPPSFPPYNPPNHPPVPVPQNHSAFGGAKTEANREAIASPSLPDPTAQTLLGEYLDACEKRPPGRVIAHLGREIKALLAEGIAANDVRDGLALLRRKGLHPSTLPSCVNQALNPPDNVRPLRYEGAAGGQELVL